MDLRPPMAVFFAYDGHAISLWQKSAKGVVAMCYITTHMVCVVRCGEKKRCNDTVDKQYTIFSKDIFRRTSSSIISMKLLKTHGGKKWEEKIMD